MKVEGQIRRPVQSVQIDQSSSFWPLSDFGSVHFESFGPSSLIHDRPISVIWTVQFNPHGLSSLSQDRPLWLDPSKFWKLDVLKLSGHSTRFRNERTADARKKWYFGKIKREYTDGIKCLFSFCQILLLYGGLTVAIEKWSFEYLNFRSWFSHIFFPHRLSDAGWIRMTNFTFN